MTDSSDNKSPSPAEPSGRDKYGRFLVGNSCGTGNPHQKKVHQLRSALLRAISAKDMQAIIKALVEKAKAGDVQATHELLDRCLGKARQQLDIDQVGGGTQFAVYVGSEIVQPPTEEGEKQD